MSPLDWKRLDGELCRLGDRCYVRFKLTERNGFMEEFVFTMRAKLSEKARERVYVERCIESEALLTSTAVSCPVCARIHDYGSDISPLGIQESQSIIDGCGVQTRGDHCATSGQE